MVTFFWDVFYLLVFVCFIAILYGVHRLRHRLYSSPDQCKATSNGLPRSLHSASIVAVEQNINCEVSLHDFGQVHISGRPDLVYCTPEGLHTPVEYKTRRQAKVWQGDIDQLSLQAWVLRQSGQPTTEHGLIVFKIDGISSRQSQMVKLKNDQECSQLVRRYLSVIHETSIPKKANDHRCKTCAHSQRCTTGFARVLKKW